MGARNSGQGIELRKGARSETIRITFSLDGKRCRESLPLAHTRTNIAYARRLQAEVLNAIARGTFNYQEFFPNSVTAKKSRLAQANATAASAKPIPTIGDLIRDALEISRKTVEHSSFLCYQQIAETHLFPRWDTTPANEFSAKELRLWIMGLPGKRKTIQLILTPLRNATAQAVADNLIDEDPFDRIKLSRLISKEQRTSDFTADPFDIDEIEAILTACAGTEERNMVLFAFTTGMRPSEYIALRWRAINTSSHYVTVTASFVDGQEKERAKTDAGLRKIDLRTGAKVALESQLAYTGNAHDLVFLNPRTREQWKGDKPIYRRWQRILRKAGVRFRNPYQTRHTFASTLLMLGAVPLYVASQMGHADTMMITRNYGKWIKTGLDGDRRARLLELYQQTDPNRANEFPIFA
ncbi:tyrosine-type recombinase/integrase [Duganella sp. FT134W]|uniref:Tyrosine-type recombinase/integrase n=1 Tax=Duganella margarita TaxID=2692170 RepID=A0A7X4KGK5_9BURK|nr:site-specific integrase [Duganella margarita]MYM73551.1 tyrosine-type recombinase/integrase [Duganella margarita]